MMKRVWLVLLTWALAGIGAVVGSILGSGGGQRWLFVGAILGGALATISAAWLASRLRLIARQQVRGASVGGLLGFAVAASLAASNLHTPVVPVLSTGLTGLGALVGGLHFAGPRNYRIRNQALKTEAPRPLLLRCSFCNKAADDVTRLIAGSHVYICSECVETCNEIIADDSLFELEAHARTNVVEETVARWSQPISCGLCRSRVPVEEALTVRDRGWICKACAQAVREAFDGLSTNL